MFATSAYRPPLPRFPLTWSAKATGRCTTGSQSTHVVHAWWFSGTFSRAVRDVLSNTYHDRCIGRGGPIARPPRSPDLNPLDFYVWGHQQTLVHAAPVGNEEALHYRIVDACQTIRNYPGIFERMRRSMLRRMEACIASHGGHFE
jgi:hypothetical protein